MKKIILSIVVALMLVSIIALPVVGAPAGKVNNNSQNLYLYPKEYADEDEWTTLWEQGAWGKYNYSFGLDGQTISGVFNGRKLTPDTEYTLISYNDPWGADPQVAIIGSSTTDKTGNVHITGSADLGADVASPVYDWNGAGDGNKIWLVLTDDISGTQFDAWNPGSYLFENNRIGATPPVA